MIDKDKLTDAVVKEINYLLENSMSDQVTFDPHKLGFSKNELTFLEEVLKNLDYYSVITREKVTQSSVTVTADRHQVDAWLRSKTDKQLPQSPVLSYKDLILDKTRSVLFLQDKNKPIDISLTNKPIIFLTYPPNT